LREMLLLPLDDLLAVTREFIHPSFPDPLWTAVCAVMGLRSCCCKRKAPRRLHIELFKDYAPGCVHVDMKYLPQLLDQNQRTYRGLLALIALLAGCTWRSSRISQQPLPAASSNA